MVKQFIHCTVALIFLGSAAMAQTDAGRASSQPTKVEPETVNCRTMEVFGANKLGVNAVIFHQRDKTGGPRLGELLQKHTGQEVRFETGDGKHHRATVYRVKSCFGRGLLNFAYDETNLGVKEDFILHFGNQR